MIVNTKHHKDAKEDKHLKNIVQKERRKASHFT